jgi:hypothetical protein
MREQVGYAVIILDSTRWLVCISELQSLSKYYAIIYCIVHVFKYVLMIISDLFFASRLSLFYT